MGNLNAEVRADRNGKLVTRHVKADQGIGAAGRAASLTNAAPALGGAKKTSFKKNWSDFDFKAPYSEDYSPASSETTVSDDGSRATVTGSNYTGYQRTTEVAKKLREDIKEAISAGYLPDGPRYNVRASSAANTQDLSVVVTGLPDAKIYDGVTTNQWGDTVRKLSDFTEGLNSRLETMVNSYNKETREYYSDSRHMYYGYVNVKDEKEVQWAADQAAKKRRAREDAIQKNVA